MRGLAGKTFLVMGGGGIGGSVVHRLAAEGANVVLGDLDAASAEATVHSVEKAGGRAIAQQCDIADEASIARIVKTAVDSFGGIDGLHANAADLAASQQDQDLLSTSLDIFDRTIAVNLRGYVLCSRLVLPELLKRGGGGIVYTSSGASITPSPSLYAYSIAKMGLSPLARHVGKTWGKQGVRANVVAPGVVLSENLKRTMDSAWLDDVLEQTACPRLGEPEDIAAMVAFLLSDDAMWVTGQTIHVNGGLLMP